MFAPLRVLLSMCMIAALACRGAGGAVPEKPQFNADIRPILSGHCFACHGPDEKHREAHLRLDVREEALREHEGTRAVVPGKPEASELLERVVSHDPDDVMPPPKSKRPTLTAEEVATLRRWIEQGAEYQGHWAFLPVRDAEPPVGEAKNPIDRFIQDRLRHEGLAPSPEADRATLIRRVAFDLTGLLPTQEEVAAFLADTAADAYEKLAERLLASPHYGERWGRHWLDQARYADSNGYAVDNERMMWPYRDWVIKALNDDMPFDRFTVEQLAGDLLPQPTKSQLIATAFHRNTLINEEGGSKPEQFRVESVLDRVNTTGAVWLGLTVGCAQCHSHKFDPISHREYYQLFSFFNSGVDVNNKGATLDVARGEIFGTGPTAEERVRAGEKLAAPTKTQAEWEAAELARLEKAEAGTVPVPWSPAHYLEYETLSNGGFQLLPDNSLLGDGRASFNDTYRVVAKSSLARVAAVRLRVLTDDSLPHRGPGLAGNGNFVLTQFEASAGGAPQSFVEAFADHEQPGFPASAAIDDQPKTGWAINVPKGTKAKMNADHEIVFVLAKPVSAADGPIELKLHHDLNENYLIGRFAIDFAETVPSAAAVPDAPILTALRVAAAQRSPAQAKLVEEAFKRTLPGKAEVKSNPNIASLMVMRDLPEPRPTFLFLRGDFLRPDEKLGPLQPGVLAAVSAPMQGGAGEYRNRLDLARWLVDPSNPLTPRVTVNRIWMRYFGRGLVETDDDFGSQGSPPTHPELLDWLARELVRQHWSQKAMHRLIVTSATYRQASKTSPEALEKDPRNLLLARQSRLRVEAEIVRDAALSASGLLDAEIGGPSVHPPQAEGVYAFTQNKKQWTASTGPERYRRGLYTMFFRSAPHPLFATFDTPDFQSVCTRRSRSDTPLQALMMANDQAFFEIAQGLADRAAREAPEGEARIERAFRLCLCRPPSPPELAALQGYYQGQLRRFQDDPKLVAKLLPKGTSDPDAAALVCVARAILNTDAFITRE